MDFAVFVTGLITGLSLIVVIGAQNAFVLRQGLLRQHVFAVCLACALSDAVLIVAGVSGFHHLVAAAPWIEPVMCLGGAAFLAWYGMRNFKKALAHHADVLNPADKTARSFAGTMLVCLALTWLNPHVYLDTLGLIGAVSTGFPLFRSRNSLSGQGLLPLPCCSHDVGDRVFSCVEICPLR